MNEFKDVNFKNGQPIRDPEYADLYGPSGP